MADYIEITDTQIEPDAPLTAVLAAQWRDNPIAIAEGAANAPRLARKLISTTSAATGISGLAGYQGCVIRYYVLVASGSVARLEFSTDNSTWPATLTLGTGAAPDGSTFIGEAWVTFADGSYILVPPSPATAVSTGTISDMPASPVYVRFVGSIGVATGGIVVLPDGGNAAS